MLIVGIDSGANGAIAFMDGESGDLLAVEDIPIDTVEIAGKNRSRVSEHRLLDLLHGADGGHAFLELPEIRPMRGRDRTTGATVMRQMGAAGAFSFGMNYGALRCACVASGLAIDEVRPGRWKAAVGAPADKDQCRRRAQELWPSMARLFDRKRDDGRAEASLIALFGYRRLTGRMAA